MRARLEVSGVRAAIHRLDDIGDRARAPEPALRHLSTLRDLNESERRRFQRGFQRPSREWQRRKARAGLQLRSLRATGYLHHALTSGTGGDIVFSAYNGELRWGIRGGRSNLYYAQALAKGVRGRRPARMVVIDQRARKSIALRVERYVVNAEIR